MPVGGYSVRELERPRLESKCLLSNGCHGLDSLKGWDAGPSVQVSNALGCPQSQGLVLKE